MLPLTLPSLVSLEWSLGVSLASSSSSPASAPSSARPFVVLSFLIDDGAGGGLRRESVELTIAQYAELARSLRDMGQQVDAL